MAVQYQLPYRQRVIAASKALVGAGEGLLESNEIIQALAHLLPVHRHHIIVQPVFDKLHAVGRLRLGDLALVVRELVLQPAAVDIDSRSEILHAHHRAL